VLKAGAVWAHATQAGVQCVLPRVAKRGVPEVVSQADGLGEFLIKAKSASSRSGDLGDLQTMREPRPKEIALVVNKDLRFIEQLSKGCRVNNPVTITLEF